ncbi:hypothetical protein, partial [Actinoplanes sp. DH11]|uniref:hypothetical protein n=1 Tax=Actinoplanes sp. DH11 TaxID=2857011 RepID=UPI001E445CC9
MAVVESLVLRPVVAGQLGGGHAPLFGVDLVPVVASGSVFEGEVYRAGGVHEVLARLQGAVVADERLVVVIGGGLEDAP